MAESGSASRAPVSEAAAIAVESGLHRTARELLMQKYNAGKKGSDFNRPLVYPPSGIV